MVDKNTIRTIIKAIYILDAQKYPLKKLAGEYPFVFSDVKTSMDFLEFLNTYLVDDGKG